ncbi:MAG TPA: hypothetical protein VMT34_05555, partial [Aggregatilineales bacterium]|nr:hypothetical protein [Aggregatilineales bacterium]
MTKARRRTVAIIFVLLAVEFLDEFIFGARESAWPLIRAELHLNYEQIGLLLGIPIVVSTLVEPLLGVLGDIWNRRLII